MDHDTMSYYMHRGGGLGNTSDSGGFPGLGIGPSMTVQSSGGGGVGGASLGTIFNIDSHASGITQHGRVEGMPEPVKKKRGRPRKYGPDGTALALSPMSPAPSTLVMSSPSTMQKRGRGRPPGTGSRQQLASLGEMAGSAGMSFTPHVFIISIGEDITTKILAFSQLSPRSVCIISAIGAVSTVTIRRPGTSCATTYEGRFEILGLSGPRSSTDNSGPHSRTAFLNVVLSTPENQVFGGEAVGVLIAASPVQVVVGSFVPGGSKTKNKGKTGPESGGESDHRPSSDRPPTPTHIASTQNLTPSSSMMGEWPGSRQMEMRNAHINIDLTHG
ncbi:hypothetical protein QJS10_CPA06g00324 [Acorus calamus]|uniref:AT-hook motif nuclear-localized protein n=1 Tax=Acorus calamus TaxID=4465 RepID=A0AAV9EK74_ACOCL|nr:hypothetical protein QJS10_CPA06g00324 [Acorus calamus]